MSKTKDNSPMARRRDDHPAKRAERAKHEALRKDQQIVADTNKVFPKHSTAASKEVAARRRKD